MKFTLPRLSFAFQERFYVSHACKSQHFLIVNVPKEFSIYPIPRHDLPVCLWPSRPWRGLDSDTQWRHTSVPRREIRWICSFRDGFLTVSACSIISANLARAQDLEQGRLSSCLHVCHVVSDHTAHAQQLPALTFPLLLGRGRGRHAACIRDRCQVDIPPGLANFHWQISVWSLCQTRAPDTCACAVGLHNHHKQGGIIRGLHLVVPVNMNESCKSKPSKRSFTRKIRIKRARSRIIQCHVVVPVFGFELSADCPFLTTSLLPLKLNLKTHFWSLLCLAGVFSLSRVLSNDENVL